MNSLLLRRLRPYRSQINIAVQFVVVTVVAALCTVLPSHAATPNPDDSMITMSPVSQRIELKAGQDYTGKFTIINAGKTDYSFRVYAAPYQIAGNDYSKQLFDEKSPGYNKESKRNQIARWVTFKQERYELKAGDKIEIPYSVNVPNSIPDGGQYGVIFAQTESDDKKAKGNAVIAQKRVGMLLYARTDGKTVEEGAASIKNPSFLELSSIVRPKVDYTNSGNTDFEATTKVTVADPFANEKYTDTRPAMVLPDTTREVEMEWKETPQFGWFKVSTEAKFLDQTVKSSSWVLVVSPFAALIIFGIFALIIGGLFYAATGRKKSRTSRR